MSALNQTHFSYCVCRIPQGCPVFYRFYRKAWLFNTHLFVCKWKRLLISLYSPETSLTIAQHTSSFLSFPPLGFVLARLLFTRPVPSFVSIPRLLASYTCCYRWFAKRLRAGMISLDTFIIRNSRQSGANVPQRCLLLILTRVSG